MNPPPASPDHCPFQQDPGSRALVDTVMEDDLDRAIALGLLAFEPASHRCDRCRDAVARLVAARDARLHALAARERYRARQTRLAERAEARARKRASAAPAPSAVAPALPAGAAAVLARAKARAAATRRQE
jgi:GNAT superfamily N-acetyltransferase